MYNWETKIAIHTDQLISGLNDHVLTEFPDRCHISGSAALLSFIHKFPNGDDKYGDIDIFCSMDSKFISELSERVTAYFATFGCYKRNNPSVRGKVTTLGFTSYSSPHTEVNVQLINNPTSIRETLLDFDLFLNMCYLVPGTNGICIHKEALTTIRTNELTINEQMSSYSTSNSDTLEDRIFKYLKRGYDIRCKALLYPTPTLYTDNNSLIKSSDAITLITRVL